LVSQPGTLLELYTYFFVQSDVQLLHVPPQLFGSAHQQVS
jgi:hypothetical protein